MRVPHPSFRASHLWLGAIILVAVLVRLYGINFGLPALYDPDEPLFVLSGVKLLAERTLNPGWFGHPGTTTIYMLALVDIVVVIGALISGRFDSLQAIATAAYADPTILVLPGRLAILVCGVACVFVTHRIGRRLYGERAGLIAAALLALNAVHISYSQIIRTDIQASLFMLLCLHRSILVAREGRLRDYLIAAIFAGAACATKWPTATIFLCIVGAACLRCYDDPSHWRTYLRHLGLSAVVMIVSLCVISPYIVLDFPTVLANLSGEAQAHHVGATGHGLLANMTWYVERPMGQSFGIVGLVLMALGIFIVLTRDRIARVTVLPVAIVFFVLISAQTLIWERWAVPLLPFGALFIAVALCWLTETGGRWGRPVVLACGLALLLTCVSAVRSQATERVNDTRALASAWVRSHIPGGSRVMLEHLAFDLLSPKWIFLLPAGDMGCLEASGQLKGKAGVGSLGKWRGSRAVVDFGTMNERGLPSCRADYAIFSHYDRYKVEGAAYAREAAQYENFVRGGRSLAIFKPKRGEIGGPFIRIFKLKSDRLAPMISSVGGTNDGITDPRRLGHYAFWQRGHVVR